MDTKLNNCSATVAAARYISMGLSVIPLAYRGKLPALPAWAEFQQRRMTWAELGKRFSGRFNVGIVTGQISGVVVVDCDTEQACEYVLRHVKQATPLVRTRKGWHFYFEHPCDGLIGNRAGMNGVTGLDLRGDGGYVVAPPSIHETGFVYRWHTDLHECRLAPLPGVFRPIGGKASAPPPPPPPTSGNSGNSKFADRVFAERIDRVRRAGAGNRNDTLNRSAFTLGQLVGLGMLDRGAVEAALADAGMAAGLTEKEVKQTVASGVLAGITKREAMAAYLASTRQKWGGGQ